MPPSKVGPKGGGLAQILHAIGAQMIDRENDIIDSIAAWQQQQRGLAEWVRRVASWYCRRAFLPAAAWTSAQSASVRPLIH